MFWRFLGSCSNRSGNVVSRGFSSVLFHGLESEPFTGSDWWRNLPLTLWFLIQAFQLSLSYASKWNVIFFFYIGLFCPRELTKCLQVAEARIRPWKIWKTAEGFAAKGEEWTSDGREIHLLNKCKNNFQTQLLHDSGISHPNCVNFSEYCIFCVSDDRTMKTSEFCRWYV